MTSEREAVVLVDNSAIDEAVGGAVGTALSESSRGIDTKEEGDNDSTVEEVYEVNSPLRPEVGVVNSGSMENGSSMREVNFAEETAPLVEGDVIRTNIPGRMDRLPWSRWHWLVVIALGITWVLDGLEITSIGVLGSRLQQKETLNFNTLQIGAIGTIYLLGAITGSIVFGIISDRFGRKQLYLIVPTCYLIPTLLTALAFNFVSFGFCVFFVGFGIGGEYSSMNSAIQEFIPARVRGGVSLIINGSYWLGAVLGGSLSLIVLNKSLFPANVGWRFIFICAGGIGVTIMVMRMFLPESPRWLVTHGRVAEAEAVVRNIEEAIEKRRRKKRKLPVVESFIEVRATKGAKISQIFKVLFITYPKRTTLGLALMVSQAFFYNAIFFTYSIVLNTFYGVDDDKIGFFLIPFAIGNFLGPLTVGRLFDIVGRKTMISSTYAISGVLLLVNGLLFVQDVFNSVTQTISWSIIFFISSSAASSAYLTVSEIFPMEMRSLAIAIFYSLGTGGGGLIGPLLFGALIADKKRINVFWGYVVGSLLMMIAAIVELEWGVAAAGRSLEDIAKPINAEATPNPRTAAFEEDRNGASEQTASKA